MVLVQPRPLWTPGTAVSDWAFVCVSSSEKIESSFVIDHPPDSLRGVSSS